MIREGEILGGKYRLEKEIGRGSMGTVWSAVHLTLGQRVAIKLIAAEHAQAAEARQRFSTEAKAAARLRSRYVVQVYDDGETPAGTPYIVLEYLDGETLEQRLERERDLPLNDAVRITRHVARALSRAHAQGIVHRDLKPANVFLARSDDDEIGWLAKVLDFGIAKLEEHGIASTTKTGTLLGTPLFMSPEQVRGASSVDGRSDLYSLGMVFYNMLSGTNAIIGESFADVLVQICTGSLPDLRAAAPWVPQSVGEWFQRACAREPNDRFQSADEMVEGLELALGVSTGAYSRQSSPEVKLDTLRGHAPPIQHSIPRATPSAADSDPGEFAPNATQALGMRSTLLDPVASNPNLAGNPHSLSHPPLPGDAQRMSHSGQTLDPELSIPTTSRWPLMLGGGLVVLLILAGLGFALGGSKPATATAQLAASSSAALPSAAPPSTAVSSTALPSTALPSTALPSASSGPALATPLAPPPATVVAPPPIPTVVAPAPPPTATIAPRASAVAAKAPPHAQVPARTNTLPLPARPAKTAENTSPRPPPNPRSPSTDMGF